MPASGAASEQGETRWHWRAHDPVGAGGEAAIAQFTKAKALSGSAKLNLVINARISLVHACKPGDHAAVLKVLDEIIADNPAELTGELKQFRAQVAAAQAADKDKK